MMKKLSKMNDIYGEKGRQIDYINRVLASFAEIYNFDYTETPVLENETLFEDDPYKITTNIENSCLKTNNIVSSIRLYFENQQQELKKVTKYYFNEKMFQETEQKQYGFVTLFQDQSYLEADTMALAVRILEAFGFKNICLNIETKTDEKNLINELDCLDIDYQKKDWSSSHQYYDECYFNIKEQMENGQERILIEGGRLNKLCKKISGLSQNAFGFSGTIDPLLASLEEKGKILVEEKNFDLIVTYQTAKELERALYLTQELRLNGFKTELMMANEIAKNKVHSKYIVEFLEENMKNDEITLIDYDTHEKEHIKEMDLINHLDLNV